MTTLFQAVHACTRSRATARALRIAALALCLIAGATVTAAQTPTDWDALKTGRVKPADVGGVKTGNRQGVNTYDVRDNLRVTTQPGNAEVWGTMIGLSTIAFGDTAWCPNPAPIDGYRHAALLVSFGVSEGLDSLALQLYVYSKPSAAFADGLDFFNARDGAFLVHGNYNANVAARATWNGISFRRYNATGLFNANTQANWVAIPLDLRDVGLGSHLGLGVHNPMNQARDSVEVDLVLWR